MSGLISRISSPRYQTMTQTIICFQLNQWDNIVMVNIFKTRYSIVTWASKHQPDLCCIWIYYSQGVHFGHGPRTHSPHAIYHCSERRWCVCVCVWNIFVKIHHVLKNPHFRGLSLMPRILGDHIWGQRLSMHVMYYAEQYWKQFECQILKWEKKTFCFLLEHSSRLPPEEVAYLFFGEILRGQGTHRINSNTSKVQLY